MFKSLALIFAVASFICQVTNAQTSTLDNCYGNNPGKLFRPWPGNQLGEMSCQSTWYGMSWCVDEKDTCTMNGGKLSSWGNYKPGDNRTSCSAEKPLCCWNDYIWCQATSLTGKKASGNCMSQSYCPAASAVPLPLEDGSAGCSNGPVGPTGAEELICCIGDNYNDNVQPCVDGYDQMFEKFFANGVKHGISENKIINFLPFFAPTYMMLQEWDYTDTCRSANYMAVVVQMLHEFADPNTTYSAIIASVKKYDYPDTALENLENAIAGAGLISPQVFGEIMKTLWMNLYLGNKGGNCADYQSTTKTFLGKTFPCDDAWRQLMANFGCPQQQ